MRPSGTTEWDAMVSAPGFALGILADDRALTLIEFLSPRAAQPARTPLAAEAAAQIGHYLKDANHRFDLPLAPGGSTHQNAVWSVMCGIPVGDTLTYGEVAKRIASSPRAVGAACGANPLPVIIPCHRIVGAAGALGGFAHAREGFLPGIKRWLLSHEADAAGFALRADCRALS
ncbi:methylated-DNA--[protein]-cysteine S-methyltransferase [Methyloversatilis universalis]|uniref:methylated-DNA--[protein]-cysteine S-methyltransferase n=1 Tax=Methyloversatilis universalis TaxID=378211 RepID=UPI0003818367|nr:methylated-DNA--[protein]-cysteine S-methyltransferase [Methyloversatilis universalis]